MISLVIIAGLVLFSGLGTALECNQTVTPVSYALFPNIYNEELVISPQVSGCRLFRMVLIECTYSVVLGDRETVPSPPNLASSEYLQHFIAWNRNSHTPYVDFKLSEDEGVWVNAVELSFLNYPASSISLPDLELSVVQYGATVDSDVTTTIESIVVDNDELTQTDSQVRTVTVQPLSPLTTLNLRLTMHFTEFHDFDWMLLSEVRFCNETQRNTTPAIQFQPPHSQVVQPGAAELTAGTSELVCTLSTEGSYTWTWERNKSVLSNRDPNYRVTVGDASRMAKLMILNLNFSSAGEYTCTATSAYLQHNGSLTQEIQFPEVLITSPEVNATCDQQVTLTCELYGYQPLLSLPVWLVNDSELTVSDKLSLNYSEGVHSLVLENGSSLPSVVVTLTIHNVSMADGGNYTCRGVREESVTRLTVIALPEVIHSSTAVLVASISTYVTSIGAVATKYPSTSSLAIISPTAATSSIPAAVSSSTSQPSPPPAPGQPSPVSAVVGVVSGLMLVMVVVCLVMVSLILVVWRVRRRNSSVDDGSMLYEQGDQSGSRSTITTELDEGGSESPPSSPVYKIIQSRNIEASGKSSIDQSAIFFYTTDL